jgi:hypothetical protein
VSESFESRQALAWDAVVVSVQSIDVADLVEVVLCLLLGVEVGAVVRAVCAAWSS